MTIKQFIKEQFYHYIKLEEYVPPVENLVSDSIIHSFIASFLNGHFGKEKSVRYTLNMNKDAANINMHALMIIDKYFERSIIDVVCEHDSTEQLVSLYINKKNYEIN